MTAILFSRAIGPVPIPCVVSEAPQSKLSITRIPLENGAKATDHAHSEPFSIEIDIASEMLAITYQALVAWQKARIPFVYVSGFDVHTNLLIEEIAPVRDQQYPNAFNGRVKLTEVLIVSSATVPADQGAGTSKTGDAAGGGKKAGGKNSRRAAAPSQRNSASGTSDRAAATVNRGEIKTNPVAAPRGQSILKSIAG